MATKQYFFYVLYCADHTLYTGYTVDLEARTASHNAGKGAKYTQQAKRRPVRLLYAEERPNRSLAMRAEARFKRLTRSQKEDYLFRHGLTSLSASQPLIIPLEVQDGTTEL